MTTPTDTPAAPAAWTAWRDKAMQLADECERCAVNAFIQGRIISPPKLLAARAALAEHLDAVPMGKPVGFYQSEPDGSISRVASQYASDPDVFPLYRHPKESA